MGRYDSEIERGLMKYSHKDLSKKDISYLMSVYKDLVPSVENFVYNTGASQALLSLTGTIPVSYKGATYNIPIALWLQDSHPFNPPMVYVKPTSTMKIKEGPHVDTTGRVFLPYLTEWKHPSSDLLGLVQILTIIFGEDCPVFSVAAGATQPHSRMPYPGTRPPYPNQAAGGYTGMPMPGMPGGGYPAQRPNYPPNPGTGQPRFPGYQGPQAYGNPYNQAYPGYSAYPPSSSAYGGVPQRPGYPMATANTQQSHAPVKNQSSISEDHIKASLLSAVKEKMCRKLEDVYGQAHAEVQCLQKTQDDLNRGKGQLEEMLTKLEREQDEVNRNIEILKQKDEELNQFLHKMEEEKNFDIDGAIVPTAPLYKQILNSFAEEQALEDTMYYLGEALRREIIELDVYLKHIRELSRRQFLLRALITRCRQKAGLPEIAS